MQLLKGNKKNNRIYQDHDQLQAMPFKTNEMTLGREPIYFPYNLWIYDEHQSPNSSI